MKDQILTLLPGDFPWKEQFYYFDTVQSTNTLARAMAEGGAPHGTVLVADRQTAGRGRRGRSFLSPPGMGIYMSVILRPQAAPAELMHLTCSAACAMCDAVEKSAHFRPGIKWTNDLVYGGRKLAGILTELSLNSGGEIAYAVIGIGINCCQREEDFSPEIREIAGSLSMAAGKPIDRCAVAAAMTEALWRMDTRLLSDRQKILQQYRKDCVTIGRDVSLVRSDSVRHGHAVGVDDEGALLVCFPDGHTEAVNSGEVSVRGMYGYV
ncbi:MAG: biotin--[acetyl-CoA-carboxylase] ligase [Faecousia sp.]